MQNNRLSNDVKPLLFALAYPSLSVTILCKADFGFHERLPQCLNQKWQHFIGQNGLLPGKLLNGKLFSLLYLFQNQKMKTDTECHLYFKPN